MQSVYKVLFPVYYSLISVAGIIGLSVFRHAMYSVCASYLLCSYVFLISNERTNEIRIRFSITALYLRLYIHQCFQIGCYRSLGGVEEGEGGKWVVKSGEGAGRGDEGAARREGGRWVEEGT